MRLVGYDRAPARLPRASGAPAPSPEALRRSRPRRAGRAGPAPRSSAGASCRAAGWRRWASARSPTASRVKNPISADYEVMRTSLLPGSSTPPAATSPAASPTSGCSRSARSSGARPTPRRRPSSRLRGGDPGRPARRLAQAGRAASTSSTPSAIAVELLRGLGVDGARVRAARRERRRCCTPASRRAIHGRAADGRRSARSASSTRGRARARPRRARRSTSRSRSTRSPARGARSAACRRRASRPSTRDISFWIDAGGHRRRAARAAGVGRRAAAARAGACSRTTATRATRPPGKKGMLWTLTYRADDRTLTDAEVDAAHARDRRRR